MHGRYGSSFGGLLRDIIVLQYYGDVSHLLENRINGSVPKREAIQSTYIGV